MNTGKYYFIPEWLLQENSQTIHAYLFILNEINNNDGEFFTTKKEIAKTLNISERQAGTILKSLSDKDQINIKQMLKKGTSITIDFIGVKEDIKKQTRQQTTQPKKNQPKKSIIERKEAFIESLKTYSSLYDKDMLNDFYRYWVETDANGEKMKFEFQKTWDVNLRLITWKRNSNKTFNHQLNTEKSKEEKIGRTSIETIKKNAEYNGQY